MAGASHVSRVGASILAAVGLADLVARDPDEYVRVAAALALDLPRLSALRASLRDRMERSLLRDAAALTRHVEAAMRAMWVRWCAGRSTGVRTGYAANEAPL